MKPLYMITALALFAAHPAFAYDLSKVDTKVMLGLTGPTKGAKLKPEVIATQPLADEGIAVLAGRNLRTRFWAIGGPDGIVPIHGHENPPAVLTVASGAVSYTHLTLPTILLV